MTTPRCVRNFWIELEVDGKKERIATGPRSSGGGFRLTIKMRVGGEIEEVATLTGQKSVGKLALLFQGAGRGLAEEEQEALIVRTP